jgi:hypothetical protein
MVSYVLAAVVLLGGEAGPPEPDPFEGASKLNPFELGEPKCNPFYGFYQAFVPYLSVPVTPRRNGVSPGVPGSCGSAPTIGDQLATSNRLRRGRSAFLIRDGFALASTSAEVAGARSLPEVESPKRKDTPATLWPGTNML